VEVKQYGEGEDEDEVCGLLGDLEWEVGKVGKS